METHPESTTHHLDELSNEINTRRSDLGRVRQFAVQGQYVAKGPSAMKGASRMQAYREGTAELSRHNQTTERLLVSPRQPNIGNGTGDHPSAITGSAFESDALHRVTLVNRTLHEKIKMLEEENDRYRRDVENMDSTINGISNDSMHTDQQVAHLADDLQIEKASHEAARRCLEDKTRQLEEQAERLSALEEESASIHDQNYGLSVKMEEMNRLAEERESGAEKRESTREDGDGDGGGSAGAAVVEELEKMKTAVELKTRQLEAVQARAAKTARTLELYQGRARGSRLRSLVWNVWVLLRTVGTLSFFLFVYVAVSEDALRSRGVDVYRLAH